MHIQGLGFRVACDVVTAHASRTLLLPLACAHCRHGMRHYEFQVCGQHMSLYMLHVPPDANMDMLMFPADHQCCFGCLGHACRSIPGELSLYSISAVHDGALVVIFP